ncbi:MAG: PfkB family carbohydrate kinase [Rhodospirillales bacterium]|nr:PfkB family carbohydrate kinase [Rhodospirillales bacterium]
MGRDDGTMFDACVIGHVLRDVNHAGGIAYPPSPGGTAFYSAMVYASLGLKTAVVTRVAPSDAALLEDLLAAGVEVFNLPSDRTSEFRNVYDDPDNPDQRTQFAGARAAMIGADDLPELRARIFHLGPLTPKDVDTEIAARCAQSGALVALDAQGLTREIVDDRVMPSRKAAMGPFLRHVDFLQADDAEIAIFSGEDGLVDGMKRVRAEGARHVIVTHASRGSRLYDGSGIIPIPALPPRAAVDATGCGDTYLAAFMSRRVKNDSPVDAAIFAAVASSLNIETHGPFRGSQADVEARRRETGFGEDVAGD